MCSVPAEGPSGNEVALGEDRGRQARNEGTRALGRAVLLSAGPDQGVVASRENVQFGFVKRRVLTPVAGCLTELSSAQGKGTDIVSPLRITSWL